MKKNASIKKVTSTLLVFMLILSSMTGITAGMYNDAKYLNVDGEEGHYEDVFLSELPSHKDLDYTRRGFLNVTYFQTEEFNLNETNGPEEWNYLSDRLVKDVDGVETGVSTYSAVSATGKIYVDYQNNELGSILGMMELSPNGTPYGKKMVIEGFIVPTMDIESLQLGTYSDDGTIVYFDDMSTPIINNWKYQAPTLKTYTIDRELLAGSIHKIRIEYFENKATEVEFKVMKGRSVMPGTWFYPYLATADENTVVDIVSPAHESGTDDAIIDVSGTTEPGNEIVELYVTDDIAAAAPTFGSGGRSVIPNLLGNWGADLSSLFDISSFAYGPFRITAITKDIYGNLATDVHIVNKLEDEYAFEFLVYPGDEAQGSILSPEGIVYAIEGADVQVQAVPAPGYRFVKWWSEFYIKRVEYNSLVALPLGDIQIIDDGEYIPEIDFVLKPIKDISTATALLKVDLSLESAIDSDTKTMYTAESERVTNLYAEFERIPTPDPGPTPTPVNYTLTVNVVGDGSVPGFEGTNTFSSGTNVNLSAVTDNPLFTFIGWSGDLVSTNVNDVVVLTSNKTVTATFAVEEEPIPEEEPVHLDPVEDVVTEVEEVLDVVTEEVPEDLELPDTSGIPAQVFALLGTSILGMGISLKKKIK